MVTIVDSKKRSPLLKLGERINEEEENDLETEETDAKGKRMIRYSGNFNLLSNVNSTKSSINTPISKPTTLQDRLITKKAAGVQNNLLNLIRMDPEEKKPGPTITSEYQERKEKKNVSNIRNNLKNFF